MVIIKDNVQMLHTKCKAINQVAFDSDFNVPDIKPDIGRMIQNKGNVTIDEVRLSEGKAFLKGILKVDILYVADGEGRVYSLSTNFPLEESVNLEGVSSGDKICIKWELEDLSVHVIHSRKMNIKAIIALKANAEEIVSIQLPKSIEDESVSIKNHTINLLNLKVHKKDTLRIKEDITLVSNKPNVHEILWSTMELRDLDLRPGEGRLQAKGEIAVFVLYEGDNGENAPQWIEHMLSFHGEMECMGCQDALIPHIESNIVSQSLEVKPDADGEERIFTADLVLELNMRLYKEEEHTFILDAYSPVKECIIHGKKQRLDSLLIRNFSRCRIVEKVDVKDTQGKVLQLCHSYGLVKIERTKIVEKGIEAEGIIHLKILYIIEDDKLPFYSMNTIIPFKHMIEANGISKKDVFYIQAELEQLSTIMADSNELEVRAAVGLNVLVLSGEEKMIIEEIEEKPLELDKIQRIPGILVYIAKDKDTIWDIAKKYYTTVKDIMEINELKDEKLTQGQALLLVKKVMSEGIFG